MDPDRVVLIALWIEGAACPTRGAGSPDFQNKPIANLFVLHAGPDPRVDAANRLAAWFDPDIGLAVAARPITEIPIIRQSGSDRGASMSARFKLQL
jgi:hypothetical protein